MFLGRITHSPAHSGWCVWRVVCVERGEGSKGEERWRRAAFLAPIILSGRLSWRCVNWNATSGGETAMDYGHKWSVAVVAAAYGD